MQNPGGTILFVQHTQLNWKSALQWHCGDEPKLEKLCLSKYLWTYSNCSCKLQ